jgi:cyanophycinase
MIVTEVAPPNLVVYPNAVRHAFLLFAFALMVAAQEATEYGPEKGTLIIVCGGNHTGTGIAETIINKAGGLSAKILIVPTAGGNRTADGKVRVFKEEEILAP